MVRSKRKQLVGALRDVDDLVHLITGKRIRNLVSRGIELFGEDIVKAAVKEPPASTDPNDPYFILGVRQDASDIVVKASFRSQARQYHPDTGERPDAHKFQRINEAFGKIMAERKWTIDD